MTSKKNGFEPRTEGILMCRLFLPAVLVFSWLHAASAAEPWEGEYARLLDAYVSPGGVNYRAWKASPPDLEALKTLTREIAAAGPSADTREAKLAYLLNAYNIWMLHEVLAAYPIQSVREIAKDFGVFSEPRIIVAGERMSLDTLEKERTLKVFKDPRIHFAVNCASISCPPLPAQPFTASRLDAQLDRVTRSFLARPGPHAYLIDGRQLSVSRLFEWYAADFNPPGTVAFINRYRDEPLPDNLQVAFLKYDWNLNEYPSPP